MKLIVSIGLLTLLLAGCGAETVPLPEFEVDPTLESGVESLPSFDGSSTRPVAAIENEGGEIAEFVSNELWISTNDDDALAALVTRWNGVVIMTFDPETEGLEGSGLERQHLVRVDTSTADTAALAFDLRDLDENATGAHRVSSFEGLGLLAASAAEAASGASVGINWIGRGADFRGQSTEEAPLGSPLGAFPYDPNPYVWPTHALATRQAIGISEAWRLLDLAGKLDNRVPLAILDQGFFPDADMRDGWHASSNIPFVDAIGNENLMPCSGGNECPYHGTNVASAAMAVPDNGYGSAGSAGPVGEGVFVSTFGDFFSSMIAIFQARDLGAKIVNMSYGVPVPSTLAFTVLPFNRVTGSARDVGMLLFASAGNQGKNVDATGRVFGWETKWYTPCENRGVICVGGLGNDSLTRHSSSNYGNENVDIFAPYTMLVGPDPSAPHNHAQAVNGTSFSSPFVAGVAALVWAADPSLHANDVAKILMETGHASPDQNVGRVINALGAVGRAVGNAPPAIRFTTLVDGQELLQDVPTRLDVLVEDYEDGRSCCDIAWTSDVDGYLGDERAFDFVFRTLGRQTLTVTATDPDGAQTVESVVIEVRNFVPIVEIVRPEVGETVFRGQSLPLRATSFDRNEPGNALDCDAFFWLSSVASDPVPQPSCDSEITFTTSGTRVLTLVADDSSGARATASVIVSVIDPPPNLPPNVRITSPTLGERVSVDKALTLTAIATDPEGDEDLFYSWSVRASTRSSWTSVGNGQTVQWIPSSTISFSCDEFPLVTIRLTVRDSAGSQGNDSVTYDWRVVC